MNKKIYQRLKAKELRKTLDIISISKVAIKLLKENSLYKNSKHIMLYYPTKYEIDLRELFNDEKFFYLPRVNGKNLDICPYKIEDCLKTSQFFIQEPETKAIKPDIIDLAIIPALMIDKNNYRLGYGGGYYDRFLLGKKFHTLSIIPKELYIDKLPIEQYDIPIEKVIIV